jgi:hypothetical protein
MNYLEQAKLKKYSVEKFHTYINLTDLTLQSNEILLTIQLHSALLFIKPNWKFQISIKHFHVQDNLISFQLFPIFLREDSPFIYILKKFSHLMLGKIQLPSFLSVHGNEVKIDYVDLCEQKLGFCSFHLQGISIFDEAIHILLN